MKTIISMITKRHFILIASLLIFGFSNLVGQKYGYINSNVLLGEVPEIKLADEEITAYQKGLIESGQTMVKNFETEYTAASEKIQKGEFSQLEIQIKESDLAKKREDIQKYEVEVGQKINIKREELYKPILDNIKNVIEQYGADNGFTMIFDISTGGVLFAEDVQNLMPQIKQKLGIQ